MIEFFDVYVGGVKIEGVDDIVSPTEEKPLWLIMRKGKVVACASKGAMVQLTVKGATEKIQYHIIKDELIKQAIEISLSKGVRVGLEGDDKLEEADKRTQETPPYREYGRITLADPEDVET
jgi:hypothetical protein